MATVMWEGRRIMIFPLLELLLNSYAVRFLSIFFFFFNDTATTEISPLPLHAALPILTARRETHDTDSLRMDAPFSGSAPHQADRPLGVLQRASSGFALGLIGAARHAVLEDDAGRANRVQPVRDFLAFELPVEFPIAASWTDQHGGSRILFLRGSIDRDGRFRDVGDHPGGLGDLDLLAVEPR